MENSKEKQIEEMAKHCPHYYKEECYYVGESDTECDMLCQYGTYAEHLYNAGYRKVDDIFEDIFEGRLEVVNKKSGDKLKKASEIAREIFEEIGKILYKYDKIAERDKSEYGELIVGDIGCAIAELKKKYTQEK